MNYVVSELKFLDEGRWEWRCGPYDFYCSNEPDLGWVLEQFESSVQNPSEAHRDEIECESFEDALLYALEAVQEAAP